MVDRRCDTVFGSTRIKESGVTVGNGLCICSVVEYVSSGLME